MATKYIVSDSATYLKYVASISQSGGSNAPSEFILENTLGEVPTFTYNSTGSYTMNFLSNALNSARTVIFIGGQVSSSDGMKIYANVSGSYTIDITTLDKSDVLSDDILLDTTIEIRIY